MFDKVFQGLILATAVSIPLAVFNGTLFSWHPTLMSLGFLGFMGNGVLTAFQFRHIMEANARVKAIQKHALWQIAAVSCIGSGFFAIYQNKARLGKQHFLTLHGKFGLLVTLLSFGAAAGGALAFRKLGLLQKLPSKLQPIVKAGHRSAGFVTFLLALVTIELALIHPSVWKGYVSVFWQLAVAGAGVLALSFLRQYSNGYLSRVWQLSVLGIGLLIFKVAAGKGGEASGPARSGASTSTRESEIAKAL